MSGIVRYLFWLGKPALVRAIEIEALQESLQGIVNSYEITVIQKNAVLTIAQGPFQGLEGIVKKINNNTVQLLLVDLGFLVTITR